MVAEAITAAVEEFCATRGQAVAGQSSVSNSASVAITAQSVGGLRKASAAQIFHDGKASGFAKGMRQMEARDVAIFCDLVEREVAAQVAFDDEQRLVGDRHRLSRFRTGLMLAVSDSARLIGIAV